MNEQPAYVYIIGKFTEGAFYAPVKVGITKSLNNRVQCIQTNCPFKIGLFTWFKCPNKEIALMLEEGFHEVLKERRTHGEWFDMPPQEAAFNMQRNVRAYIRKYLEVDGEEAEKYYQYVCAEVV